jgi:hypothetical protein
VKEQVIDFEVVELLAIANKIVVVRRKNAQATANKEFDAVLTTHDQNFTVLATL